VLGDVLKLGGTSLIQILVDMAVVGAIRARNSDGGYAIATGYLFSQEAGKIAVLVKSTRNALIGFVVLGFALYWAAREADQIAPGFRSKATVVWEKFPKFVLGFLAVSAIATAGWLSKGQTANLANVSKWAFLLTFAGVGLNTNFGELARTGWRPMVVAVIGLIVVAAVSLGLVLLTSRVFGGVHTGARTSLRPSFAHQRPWWTTSAKGLRSGLAMGFSGRSAG
jgi:putative effector of murein hydrolase LrgA (UPF0299 family)